MSDAASVTTPAKEPTVTVDGKTYAFPRNFTFVEDRIAFAIAGVHAGSLVAELAMGNPQPVLALAVVAMKRAGVDVDMDKLENLPVNLIEVDFGNAVQDGQSPPADAVEPVAEAVAAA
jgi:hypothetical protein